MLELFPMVAKGYLTGVKKAAYEAKKATEAPAAEVKQEAAAAVKTPVTGDTVKAPLPGKVIEFKVKVGDKVAPGQEVVILEAMKMENAVATEIGGYVKQLLVPVGENVATDALLIEISQEAPQAAAAPAAKQAVTGKTINAPLPGKVIAIKVQAGDEIKAGQEVMILEAMKMENSINSDFAGKVKQVLVAEGDNVATDAPLIEVE